MSAERDEQIEAAITALSLEQKVRLLSGAESFALAANESIGLAAIVLSDGPTGVRGPVVVGGRESCLLPNASLLAQTWSTGALAEAATVLAEEAIDQRTHVVLGPTINLHRTPLGGRLFEAFSEDPLLTGRLAAAYVRSLQKRGIGASVKHFLANESETERTTVDSVIAPEVLREVYLKPFEIVVEDADPWTLMAAYNRVNGVPSTEQRELIGEVVKGEWGYDGLVMSDWLATSSTVESVTAGLDLVMPGPDTPWSESLVDEVRAGSVPEAVLDEHVRRVLRLARRVGAFGQPRAWPDGVAHPASPQRRTQLRDLAARGMVVLKNDGGVLPLDPRGEGRVVAIGRHATDTIAQGGGSAQVRPPHVVSIADGLRARFGDRLSVVDGVETRVVLPAADPARVAHPLTGEPGIRARVFDDAGVVLHDRHLDVAELEDSKTGWLADAARIELSAAVQLPAPTSVQLGVRGPGRWHISAPGHEEDVEIAYHQGPGGGFFRPRSHATTVRLEPGAVLTATTERAPLPRILGIVLAEARRSAATAISAAVAAAQDVETAVVVVGNTADQETEGQDKHTLALPGDQDALVKAVAGVARRTVVVVNAATPVLMPWADDVDAILFVGLPGQEAGDAVAAALTGDVLPEGRLVTTFPAADGEGPAWTTTPVDGKLRYAEGRFVGYRGWRAGAEQPAYWFGHGLGYTTWAYGAVRAATDDEGLVQTVTTTVENCGEHAGIETVQVYLEPDDADQPVRLIGWAQARLDRGEAAQVRVECDPRLQRRWSVADHAWQPLTRGTILVGRSLGDVRATIRSTGSTALPAAEPAPADRIEA